MAIERLDIPNGFNMRVSPDGRFVTMNNVEAQIAELERDGDAVRVKAGSLKTLSTPPHQAYGGWFPSNGALLWWQDVGAQRFRHKYSTASGVEVEMASAHGSYFMARDGEFIEHQAGVGMWRNGVLIPGSEGTMTGPPQICEGWLLQTTDQSNTALRRVSPQGDVTVHETGETNLQKLGPAGLFTYGAGGHFSPGQIQPPNARFPWGEVPDWIWRRPNGEVWFASHVLDPVSGSYLLLRPWGSLTPIWLSVPPLDYLSIGDDGQRIIAVGSYNADGWATAVNPAQAVMPWPPPETPVDPPKPVDPPVPPQPSPVILASTEAGVAPLLVGATAHYLPVDKPVMFFYKRVEEVAWALAATVPAGTAPAYTYRFPLAGTFNVTAGSGELIASAPIHTDIRTVVVTAAPPPEPEPPSLTWKAIAIKLIKGLLGRKK